MILRALLLSTALLGSSLAAAQSIEVGQLGAAQDFDAGVIDFNSGGLDPALWQGTNAKMATHLLSKAPLASTDSVIKNMIRAVVLTAGVPPEGTDAGYAKARLRSVMALNDPAALQNLAARSPDIVADSAVRADLALAVGEVDNACTMADSISEGRGTPSWARLRAFCHVHRSEIPAAELTANLLKNSGYEDEVYFELLARLTGASKKTDVLDVSGDPLYAAMAGAIAAKSPAPLASTTGMTPLQAMATAKDPKASPDARLAAVFKAGNLLDDGTIAQILNGVIYDGVDVNDLAGASEYNLDTAKANPSGKGFAQLFTLAKQGGDPMVTAKAASEVLKRADDKGAFERFSQLLENEIVLMPAEAKAAANLKIFAKAAVLRNDIGALQGLHGALEDDAAAQARIALAADALGNGFRLGDLGRDIEDRLNDAARRPQALRDAYIALALGSTLSTEGALALEDARMGAGRSIPAGSKAALHASAKASSRAETTLRAAIALDGRKLDGPSMAAVIEALMDAQLTQFAGQIAALDYLNAL